MPLSRTRERVANTLLVVFSVSIALALVEVGLRIIDFNYISTWRFDSITGKALLPGAEMWNKNEGMAFVQVNSDGLRDIEHTIEKPENTLRIAILGDSYAEAIQVPLEQTFWSILQDKLGTCSQLDGKDVEVINFGISGFGTVQELLTLRHKVWKYSPDIVLLAFLTDNDIRNNVRELQLGGNQPYFIYEKGKLVLDDSFLDKPKSRLMGSILGDWWFASVVNSRILQLLVKSYHYISHLEDADDKEARKSTQQTYHDGLSIDIYSPPSDPVWVNAWNVTEDLLRLMHTDVIAHNATFMLVTLSNGIQVNPDAREREAFAASIKVDDLFYPDKRIEDFTRKQDIPFLMLAPSLLAWAESHGECVHGFDNAQPCSGHWNAHGHRIAGILIAENICSSLP